MKKILLSALTFFVILTIGGCSTSEQKRTVIPAFYYTLPDFNLSAKEAAYMDSVNTAKIYVHFFDVDLSGGLNQPVASNFIKVKNRKITGVQIVPAVFITNRSFLKLKNSEINSLADSIVKNVNTGLLLFDNPAVKEIQLDCDWNETTKEKYFNLIKSIKQMLQQSGKIVTVVIRYNQLKYFKSTGVPPVNSCMLKFYDMLPVSELKTDNSIFDLKQAKEYLPGIDAYPLHLNIALPAYSWGAVFRSNRLIALIDNITSDELLQTKNYLRLDNIRYKALNDAELKNVEIKKGDIIRLEITNPRITKRAAETAAPYIKGDSVTVAIYSLSGTVFNGFNIKNTREIFGAFK